MELFNRYFLDTIKQRYADFEGKATRSEYWYFLLFYLVISFILAIIDVYIINAMLGMTLEESSKSRLLQFLFALAMIVPFLALGVRRLHDIGKSGWWMFIGLIPVFGTLVLLYFFVHKSK